MLKNKLHIIIVTQEGARSITCGVGMIVANLIDSLPELGRKLGVKNPRFSVIALERTKSNIGYDSWVAERTNKICIDSKGKAYYIKSQWRNKYGYFDIPVWRNYNSQARKIITKIAKKDELTLVVHQDGIFGGLQNLGENIYSVWVPNSLSIVHQQTYCDLTERDEWEKEIIQLIQQDPNSYIGCVSKRTRELLVNHYNIPPIKLIDTYNGFSKTFLQRYISNPKTIEKQLKANGIPTDKKLILSYGRPDEYKGLNETLKGLCSIAKSNNAHVVMIASLFSEEPIVTKIQSQLKKIQNSNQGIATLITRFEFTLPKLILQWNKTALVACLPRRDFAPLIPTEAALLGHKRLKIMTSNIACFQSESKIRKNIQTSQDLKSIIRTGNRILKGTNGTEAALREFKKHLIKHSDISYNYALGLGQLIQKIESSRNLERSAGAIVIRKFAGLPKILLVKHRRNTYVFPKGHIEKTENSMQAALRELREETGYENGMITKKLGEYIRKSLKSDDSIVDKSIVMYEVRLRNLMQKTVPEEKYKWVSLRDAQKLLRYKEDRDFLKTILQK